jgi:hypothetical protein
VIEREKTSEARGDVASYNTGTAISEPIETEYLKFWLLDLLGSCVI